VQFIITFICSSLTYPNIELLSQNFKEHYRKMLHFITWSFLILIGTGSTLVTNVQPTIYYKLLYFINLPNFCLLPFVFILNIYIYASMQQLTILPFHTHLNSFIHLKYIFNLKGQIPFFCSIKFLLYYLS